MTTIDRMTFLRRGAIAAAGMTLAGPLLAYSARTAAGAPTAGVGYGELMDRGDLALPRGFSYRVISRQGDPMSDGATTPGIFDGMAAFPAPGKRTILIRNHENRRRAGETPVVVPSELRYTSDPSYNAGCTKLVVSADGGRVLQSFGIQGGSSTNCAGGVTPWGTWITCEEVFDGTVQRHGYAFEIDAYATGPVKAEPIRPAGRFSHEAVAWLAGALYETEDRGDAALYRYVPDTAPRRAGDLARSTGRLQALVVTGMPGADTGNRVTAGTFAVGRPFPVQWVDIATPEPAGDTVRREAQGKGAARFSRTEGCWVAGDKLYFDCTDGGAARLGQIWELDVRASTLTLIFESAGPAQLRNPDNLVVTPTGDLLLCEDTSAPQFLRLLTTDGRIADFARAITIDSEFAGACFDPSGRILFVNQQGDRESQPGVTYAITGPWQRPAGAAA